MKGRLELGCLHRMGSFEGRIAPDKLLAWVQLNDPSTLEVVRRSFHHACRKEAVNTSKQLSRLFFSLEICL